MPITSISSDLSPGLIRERSRELKQQSHLDDAKTRQVDKSIGGQDGYRRTKKGRQGFHREFESWLASTFDRHLMYSIVSCFFFRGFLVFFTVYVRMILRGVWYDTSYHTLYIQYCTVLFISGPYVTICSLFSLTKDGHEGRSRPLKRCQDVSAWRTVCTCCTFRKKFGRSSESNFGRTYTVTLFPTDKLPLTF